MPQFIKEGEYATVEEAACIIGIKPVSVRSNIREGKLSHLALGTLPFYLVPMESVIDRKERRTARLKRMAAKLEAVSGDD